MAMTSHRNMEKIQAQLFKACPAKELHKDTLLFATTCIFWTTGIMYIRVKTNYQFCQDSISISKGSSS